MVVLTLLGCAPCPTFDEMTVDDPKELASDNMLADIDAALADFAAWTGRDGVCVPSIEVREDVYSEHDLDYDIVGLYRGEHEPILIQTGEEESTQEIIIHELCHALDYNESLSDSWPDDAFPFESVEENSAYPTEEIRTHEAFARVCEKGPGDMVLIAALDAQCGADWFSSGEEYVGTDVYSAFPTTQLDPAPFSLTVDSRALVLDPEYTIYDATGFDGSVFLLVDWFDLVADDGYRMRVLQVDPTTGAVTGQVDIPASGPTSDGLFADSDGLPIAIVNNDGGDESFRTEAFVIDPLSDSATNLGISGLPEYVDSAAYMDGLLYVGNGGNDPPRLAVWDPVAGTQTDLHGDAWVMSLEPTAEGLERSDYGGVYRLNADDTWSQLATRPLGVWGFVPLVDQNRLWIGGSENNVPVLLNVSTGTWRMPEDPCDTPANIYGGATALFTVDGEPFVLGTSRDDGTGVLMLYAIHVEAGEGL